METSLKPPKQEDGWHVTGCPVTGFPFIYAHLQALATAASAFAASPRAAAATTSASTAIARAPGAPTVAVSSGAAGIPPTARGGEWREPRGSPLPPEALGRGAGAPVVLGTAAPTMDSRTAVAAPSVAAAVSVAVVPEDERRPPHGTSLGAETQAWARAAAFDWKRAATGECSRADCPCSSTWNGVPGGFCCARCEQGVPCPIDFHTAPHTRMETSVPCPPIRTWGRRIWQACAREDCPCKASWNGICGEFCCLTCRGGQACPRNLHPSLRRPSGAGTTVAAPPAPARQVRGGERSWARGLPLLPRGRSQRVPILRRAVKQTERNRAASGRVGEPRQEAPAVVSGTVVLTAAPSRRRRSPSGTLPCYVRKRAPLFPRQPWPKRLRTEAILHLSLSPKWPRGGPWGHLGA